MTIRNQFGHAAGELPGAFAASQRSLRSAFGAEAAPAEMGPEANMDMVSKGPITGNDLGM